MNDRRGEIGWGIALVLRTGTILAVAAIGAGALLAVTSGAHGPGPTPVVGMLRGGGADALIGAGILALTLTPPAAVLVAATGLARAGERSRAAAAILVFVLLLASLVAATLVGGTS
jgi:hypothetical protein